MAPFAILLGEGNGNPLQYSCLENPVDGGAWWASVHRATQSWNDWSNLACMHALEKEMATHPSILAWRIPGTEEPGALPSMGSHRVGHDWSDLAAAAAAGKPGVPTAHGVTKTQTWPGNWTTALFFWFTSKITKSQAQNPVKSSRKTNSGCLYRHVVTTHISSCW